MRTCLALDLKNIPELIEQYEQFHTPAGIWPEIPAGIAAGGITDMQIYRVGHHLFMIVETEGHITVQQAFEKIGGMPRQPEWSRLMGAFQERLAEAAPGEHWAAMKSVFQLRDHLPAQS